MTETTIQTPQPQDSAGAQADAVDEQLAAHLVEQARERGISLVGRDGLLGRVTKLVLEGELTDHLGYPHGDPAVRNRQRCLMGVEDLVVSLVAKGLTTGEVAAHPAEVYGTRVSRQTISTITDRVLEGLAAFKSRPLDAVYPVIFIDAIQVKIRDGAVANRPIYVALGVTCDGERDILGLWAGDGDQGAKYWLHVLTEVKNRGVADVCIVVCDGLTGLPDAISTVWPQAITQTCVVHLLRNSFRYASRRDWAAIARDLRPIYTAPTE